MWEYGFYPTGTIGLVLGTVFFIKSLRRRKPEWHWFLIAMMGAVAVVGQVTMAFLAPK